MKIQDDHIAVERHDPTALWSFIKREQSVSSFLPYLNHVTDNVIHLDSGDYMFVVRLGGVPYESASTNTLNGWHQQLNGTLRNIASPNVAAWTHIVRREHNPYPEGEFKSNFIRDLNEKYKNQMQRSLLLINELYVSVIYRPETLKVGKWLDKIFNTDKKQAELAREQAMSEVRDLMATVVAALDDYDPTVLGYYEHNGHLFDETGEFLGYLLNGEWHRIPVARNEMRNVLPISRLFFGKGGLMTLKSPTTLRYAAMLGIQEYPNTTVPGTLDALLNLPFELVLGQSITFLSKTAAKGRMKRQRDRLLNAGDEAKSQIEDIEHGLDELISNEFVMGTHSLAIMVKAEHEADLKDCISMAGTALGDSGMKWNREDAALGAAFWSIMPGNFQYRIRMGDITSKNFAGFSSFHNYPIGRLHGNQWGNAITMFETTAGGPFYFSFHKGEEGADAKKQAKLDPNHKELANCTIIGMSGAGKTVLANLLLSLLQKADQRPDKPLSTIFFDKDQGAAVSIRASGGTYFPLKIGLPSGFNPFRLPQSPRLLVFLEDLLTGLAKREGDRNLTVQEEKDLSQAIRHTLDLPEHLRTFSSLMQALNYDTDDGLYSRLAKWADNGTNAWLFDNQDDTLNVEISPIIGFDVTEFLDNDEVRSPLLKYLLFRIEAMFDGRRVAIFLDEFWKILQDPTLEKYVINKLVTIRKQDGFICMMTQAPEQITNSKASFAVIQQSATQIFLPNTNADREAYTKRFKLTEKEFEIVRSLKKSSRRFLVKQGQASTVCGLNLRGFEDELAVLSGNTATSLLADEIIRQYGSNPDDWLPMYHEERRRRLNAE